MNRLINEKFELDKIIYISVDGNEYDVDGNNNLCSKQCDFHNKCKYNYQDLVGCMYDYYYYNRFDRKHIVLKLYYDKKKIK